MLWGVRLSRALRATTGNALYMHWCDAEDVPWGTDAIHQDTPAEIPRQLAFLDTRSSRPARVIRKPGHRTIAQVVPRAGVVNARRPGRRPGRSEAKSIDEAEHGASLKCAMVASGIWIRKRWRSFRETLGRARAHFLYDSSAASSLRIWTRTPARAQRVCCGRPMRADSDIRHDQRWRERPRLDGLGSLARQDSGVVHAIVGSPTATPTPTMTAA
jgi:hypothetical protein